MGKSLMVGIGTKAQGSCQSQGSQMCILQSDCDESVSGETNRRAQYIFNQRRIISAKAKKEHNKTKII